MERRGLLRALAALAAGAAAGCTTEGEVPETASNGPVGVRETPTPRDDPATPTDGSDPGTEPTTTSPAATTAEPTTTRYPLFEIANFDAREAENGNVLVEVTVENTSDRHHVQLLVITLETEENLYFEERYLSLPVDGSLTINHRFPVSYEAFRSGELGGKLDFDVRRETPSTPITVRTGEITLTPPEETATDGDE